MPEKRIIVVRRRGMVFPSIRLDPHRWNK
jgi:hypothetical protein